MECVRDDWHSGCQHSLLQVKIKNWYQVFTFSDTTCGTYLRIHLAIDATLVWDLHREFKFRVWHPFWDGMFGTLKKLDEQQDPDQPDDDTAKIHPLTDAIDERWEVILEQVEDAGITLTIPLRI